MAIQELTNYIQSLRFKYCRNVISFMKLTTFQIRYNDDIGFFFIVTNNLSIKISNQKYLLVFNHYFPYIVMSNLRMTSNGKQRKCGLFICSWFER